MEGRNGERGKKNVQPGYSGPLGENNKKVERKGWERGKEEGMKALPRADQGGRRKREKKRSHRGGKIKSSISTNPQHPTTGNPGGEQKMQPKGSKKLVGRYS